MSEIDKLVNRAYPDELRRVTPIAVDEGAVLAQTLEKLGLAGAKRPSRRRRRPERYAGRHEARREARLVEVPVEPILATVSPIDTIWPFTTSTLLQCA